MEKIILFNLFKSHFYLNINKRKYNISKMAGSFIIFNLLTTMNISKIKKWHLSFSEKFIISEFYAY